MSHYRQPMFLEENITSKERMEDNMSRRIPRKICLPLGYNLFLRRVGF